LDGPRRDDLRVGIGWDLHPLVEGRPLVLGGVEIPFERGLGGHSDADVLVHAICDALLGGASLGDLGGHFPSEDPRYRGISSLELLTQVARMVRARGWEIGNVDAVVLAQAPRLSPFLEQMRKRLSEVMDLPLGVLSIKVKSPEALGALGRGEGIGALAVALLRR